MYNYHVKYIDKIVHYFVVTGKLEMRAKMCYPSIPSPSKRHLSHVVLFTLIAR